MNILLLDEDLNNLSTIEEYLTLLNINSEIYKTNNIENALNKASSQQFDVAIMEAKFASESGISIAKEFKKFNSKINIIFVTSCPTMVKEALKIHASDFIDKPITKEELEHALSNLLYPINNKVYFKTLGGFDVFIDNKLFAFKRAKSKELLAYLFFKQGSSSTRKELISALFDDDKASNQNYFSKIYGDLVSDLKNVGADNLVIKKSNQYAINNDAYSCDYSKKEPSSSYLQGYKWSR